MDTRYAGFLKVNKIKMNSNQSLLQKVRKQEPIFRLLQDT